MRKPQTAVIWRAVSSDDQVVKDGDIKVSLDNQLLLARDAADRHDLKVVATITVPGESRYITLLEDAREQVDGHIVANGLEQPCKPYQALFDMIRAKPRAFDVLICLNTSRLGRKASLAMTVIQLCRDAGIICYETQSPQPTLDLDKVHTYNDMLLYAINSVRDQQEVIKLIEANDAGMIRRVENGHFPGKPPYGWRQRYDERGKIIVEIDDEAADVIRFIFDRYLNFGEGLEKISDQLNLTEHAAPRGPRWRISSIEKTINKAWRYAGYNEINHNSKSGRRYIKARSRWPAIITEEQAAAAMIEKQRRAYIRRGVSNPHMFSGCVWCVTCARRHAIENGLDPATPPEQMLAILGDNLTIRNDIRMVYCFSSYVAYGRRYEMIRYRCRNKHLGAIISVRKIKRAVEYMLMQTGGEKIELTQDKNENQTENIQASIALQEAKIEKLKASILSADDDHYLHGRIDTERHQRIVVKLNEQIDACNAEILNLTKRLASLQYDNKRNERVSDFFAYGLEMLNDDNADSNKANVFFRKHLRVWAEDSRVVRMELI